MSEEQGFATVYRTADPDAPEEAAEIRDLLAEAGLSPALLGDDAPGVPVGAYEVRVPVEQSSLAEAVIQAAAKAVSEPADNSSDMDLVDVFEGVGTTAEMEAMGVRAVLDANGIPSVLVGVTPYPILPFRVRVPRIQEEAARRALEAARTAGPAAAEEAERSGEA